MIEASESVSAHGSKASGSQNVETLGQLVGQIAHDLNNLIATVKIGVELASRLEIDAHARRLLEGVLQSIAAQEALTLALSHASRACERSARLDLHMEIEAAANDVRAMLGNGIDLDLRLDAARTNIHSDARFLRTALVHLAMESRASMPAGGSFMVTTRNMTPSAGADRGREFVLLQTVDSGNGAVEETRTKAFEMFVDASPALGLAQVRDTVRRSGGSARLEGTVITSAFPLAP